MSAERGNERRLRTMRAKFQSSSFLLHCNRGRWVCEEKRVYIYEQLCNYLYYFSRSKELAGFVRLTLVPPLFHLPYSFPALRPPSARSPLRLLHSLLPSGHFTVAEEVQIEDLVARPVTRRLLYKIEKECIIRG